MAIDQNTPGPVSEALGRRSTEDDARRFAWMLMNPDGARHLLLLLQQGKGDELAFCTMVDRIDLSERAAIAKATA